MEKVSLLAVYLITYRKCDLEIQHNIWYYSMWPVCISISTCNLYRGNVVNFKSNYTS